ncbi:hypothetical protein P692DRAFT_201386460 [Suillus brevipes Sb2]|nr:hypothetical protein P692DRAFT_201386460 [Suillus brevipes Sb2]
MLCTGEGYFRHGTCLIHQAAQISEDIHKSRRRGKMHRLFRFRLICRHNGAAYDGGSHIRELSRSAALPTRCRRLCDVSIIVIKTMPSNHLYGPKDSPLTMLRCVHFPGM